MFIVLTEYRLQAYTVASLEAIQISLSLSLSLQFVIQSVQFIRFNIAVVSRYTVYSAWRDFHHKTTKAQFFISNYFADFLYLPTSYHSSAVKSVS